MSGTAFIAAQFDSTGSLFAAVYPGLDGHRLRVLPVGQSSLQAQEFALDRSAKVSTLTWAAQNHDRAQQQKKRKKVGVPSNSGGSELDVVILGTTQGSVLLYSPAAKSVTATAKTGSTSPIVSIVSAVSKPGFATVLQKDSTVTELDLGRATSVSSTLLPVTEPTAFIRSPHVVANTAPHLLNGNEVEMSFTGFASSVKQVVPLGNDHFAAAAEEDREILVYKLGSPRPVNSLICPATNVVHISASDDSFALAATTEDGQVHVFTNPTRPTTSNEKHGKRSKAVPHSKPHFSIEALLAKKGSPALYVTETKFADDFLLLAWPEQGSLPVFDSIQWRKGDEVVSNNIKLEKTPSAPLAKENLIGGVDPAAVPAYNEQSTKVISGTNVQDLSDDETLADRLEVLEVELRKGDRHKDINGDAKIDEETEVNDDDFEDLSGDGDIGTENSEETNRVSRKESRQRRKEVKLKLAQPGSFAVLLNQALTLNDKQLLEICLEERDPTLVKTSIVKLEPTLVASLLEHLALSMARSQNRSATLMQWIRWVVVIHGGYLVTVPNLLKTLASLHSTLATRAATLQRLLALQGRLELLEEQHSVRRELSTAAGNEVDDEPEAYYDEEEALIVNGEEASGSDSDAEENGLAPSDEDGSGISEIGSEADADDIMLSDGN